MIDFALLGGVLLPYLFVTVVLFVFAGVLVDIILSGPWDRTDYPRAVLAVMMASAGLMTSSIVFKILFLALTAEVPGL